MLKFSDVTVPTSSLPKTGAVTSDFNGDGTSDLLWRNSDGTDSIWQMKNNVPAGVSLQTVPTSWSVAGTGDFNGDGKSDILWRNTDGDGQ